MPQPHPPRRRRGLLLGLGIAAIAIGAIALASVALVGVGLLLNRLGDPITEFNANLDHTFTLPNDNRSYVIGAVVDSMGDPAPDHTLRLTTPEGAEVALTPARGYHTLFGRDQRLLANFTPEPGTSTLTVRADAGPNEHFVVGREPEAELHRIQSWAYPSGAAALICIVAGLGMLMAFFATTTDRDSLDGD